MFGQKKIRVLVQNAIGDFKEGVNTYEFKDLPIEATIKRNGSSSLSSIKIYGISKEHINSITRLPSVGLNQDAELKVALYVDEGVGESLLYVGAIRDASPVYTQAPDVYIDIQCVALAFQNLMGNVPPNSFERGARVPDMYKAICASYGVPCVDMTQEKEVLAGSIAIGGEGILNRLNYLKSAYKKTTWVNYNEVIYVYNVGKEVIRYEITPDDYIGYPSFIQYGISLRFDKLITFKPAEGIEIKGCELDMVNRKWALVSIEYRLSTKVGGKWEMVVTCNKLEEENAS